MTLDAEQREQNARDVAQLIRLEERLSDELQKIRGELSAPAIHKILKDIRNRTGATADEAFAKIRTAVEEAVRALKVFESQLRQELFDDADELTVEGIPELPPHLARFLAEKTKLDGFRYDVQQDPVRGWVIRWKEHTAEGTIRGYGQIYERPHAWLDE